MNLSQMLCVGIHTHPVPTWGDLTVPKTYHNIHSVLCWRALTGLVHRACCSFGARFLKPALWEGAAAYFSNHSILLQVGSTRVCFVTVSSLGRNLKCLLLNMHRDTRALIRVTPQWNRCYSFQERIALRKQRRLEFLDWSLKLLSFIP